MNPARLLPLLAFGLLSIWSIRAADKPLWPAADEDAVRTRFDLAKTLVQSGKYAEALEHYLWCYDDGMIAAPSYSGVRTSFLTGEIGRLAAKYPPAREALVTRRDDAKTRLLANPGDRRAPTEFAALNEALGDKTANLALFDELPSGDARRRGLGVRVYRELLARQRYKDALEAQPYNLMSLMFDSTVGRAMKGTGPSSDSTKAFAIETVGGNVEVLAGAGELAQARELMGRLLAADSSDATKEVLRKHLDRAKHPELLVEAKP